MSPGFWFELLLALAGFFSVVLLLPKLKAWFAQRAEAKKLRPVLTTMVQQLLAMFVVEMRSSVPGAAQSIDNHQENNSAYLRAAIQKFDEFLPQAIVLFKEEQLSLQLFSAGIKAQLTNIKAGTAFNHEVEDLILLGQRLANNLKEHS
ncbi:MAG: hypothetical protein ACI9FR_002335 [Cryomorphaceae bacterium]|jgi:hypothetical protein